MLLVALHKVLGLACSLTLALFFLLPPLVTAHPASKIGSSAFSQQRKCRSYNLTHGRQLCRVGRSSFVCAYAQGTWPMSKTSCLLDRGGGLYAPGASAYPCGGFCRVRGAFQVSPWKERERRCPKTCLDCVWLWDLFSGQRSVLFKSLSDFPLKPLCVL